MTISKLTIKFPILKGEEFLYNAQNEALDRRNSWDTQNIISKRQELNQTRDESKQVQ